MRSYEHVFIIIKAKRISLFTNKKYEIKIGIL